jgi:hypothetical protein
MTQTDTTERERERERDVERLMIVVGRDYCSNTIYTSAASSACSNFVVAAALGCDV